MDGEWWLAVETAADVVGCDACGTRAGGHGRQEARVRDLPLADRGVVLVWRMRIWRCPDSDGWVKTWTEEADVSPPDPCSPSGLERRLPVVGCDGHLPPRGRERMLADPCPGRRSEPFTPAGRG